MAILMVEEQEEAVKMVLGLPPRMVMVEDELFLWLVFLLLQKNVVVLFISFKVQVIVEGEYLMYLLIALEDEEGMLAVPPSSIVME